MITTRLAASAVSTAALTLALLTLSAPAQATGFGQAYGLEAASSLAGFLSDPAKLIGTDSYRIGLEWGKKPVTADQLTTEGPVFRRAALATAKYGSATAFYLGVINGRHLMGTNYHVAQAYGCGAQARFQMSGVNVSCQNLYGMWPEIDFALFSIQPTQAQAAKLLEAGQSMDFNAPIYPGQELLTIGHGTGGNPMQVLVANRDNDCVTFSENGEFRLMGDPDEYNPGPYKAWSFANGCDVSHGDSGSAYVDRRTGAIVGLVWTGKVPKSRGVQVDSQSLRRFLTVNPEKIWTELTYSVPAAKIREHLNQVLLSDPNLSPEARATIEAFINP